MKSVILQGAREQGFAWDSHLRFLRNQCDFNRFDALLHLEDPYPLIRDWLVTYFREKFEVTAEIVEERHLKMLAASDTDNTLRNDLSQECHTIFVTFGNSRQLVFAHPHSEPICYSLLDGSILFFDPQLHEKATYKITKQPEAFGGSRTLICIFYVRFDRSPCRMRYDL